MRSRIKIILPICVLVALSFIPQTVIADSGTQTVNEDEYWSFSIPLEGGGSISYTISVSSGPRIDVFLLDEENYAHYRAQETFHYIAQGSDMDTSYCDNSVSLTSGTYYLIVDNTDAGGASPPWDGVNNPATFDYFISSTSASETLEWLCILGGLVVVIIIIVTIAVFIATRKKSQTTQSQQPQFQSSYQQPQYPPQSPQTQYQPPPQQPQYQAQPSSYQPPPQQISNQFKICPSCGRQIPIDSRLCSYCGLQLT